MNVFSLNENILFSSDESTAYFTYIGMKYLFEFKDDYYIYPIESALDGSIQVLIKDSALVNENKAIDIYTFDRSIYLINKKLLKDMDINNLQLLTESLPVKEVFKFRNGVITSNRNTPHIDNEFYVGRMHSSSLNKKSVNSIRKYSTTSINEIYPTFTYKQVKTTESSILPDSILKSSVQKSKTKDNYNPEDIKILTLDYETRMLKDNTLEVISCVIYDGKFYNTFYITDYANSKDLIKASITRLLNKCYSNYSVYIHNLSGFDGIFLIKHFMKLINLDYDVKYLIRDDKMLNIKITKEIQTKFDESKLEYLPDSDKVDKDSLFDVKFLKFNFYDSYLLLPVSLNKLAKSFLNSSKLDFDTSTNDTADLNDINFRNKLLEYNKQDCKVLYDIIIKFNNDIKELFDLDIKNIPTLSSLAFKIFRSNFMKSNIKINITNYEEYQDFKEAYRGGAVDVYKPYGKDLFYYDVNSLYPSVMKFKPYPVGDFKMFLGNRDLNGIFGVVYCKVTAPNFLNVPILLHQIDGKILAPVGSWEGWYCSEELKLAVKHGYKVNVISGYHWPNKAFIFKNYVDTLYSNRLKYPKSDPKNLINKLLLNSLYGRFGMSPNVIEYMAVNREDMDPDKYFEILRNATDIINYDEINVDFIGTEKIFNQIKGDKNHASLNINTPIALFVTAYSRMFMAEFKLKYADNLYYTDTDSLVLDCKLPNKYVGDNLGQFKLEYKIKEGVFLSPKVYSLVLEDNTEVTKIKGSKKKLAFSELYSLLKKDHSLELNQVKWFRNKLDSNIELLNTLYTLKLNDNKRQLIFDKDNIFIDTIRRVNILKTSNVGYKSCI